MTTETESSEEPRTQRELAPREINASRRQREPIPWQRAFMSAREAWGPELRELARELSRDRLHYAADLVQEAEVRLWELDASRFDERDHEWVKGELRARMRQAAKRERRQTSPRTRVPMSRAAEEKPLLGLLEVEVEGWE